MQCISEASASKAAGLRSVANQALMEFIASLQIDDGLSRCRAEGADQRRSRRNRDSNFFRTFEI